MQRLRVNIDEAESQINVKLQRRSDLIPNLVNTVKGYAKHESSVLEKVTALRANLTAGTTQDKINANNQLSSTLKSLFAVAESYPDLKANVNDRYNDIKRDIKEKVDSVSYAYQEAKEKKEAERANKEQELAIKRAQLDSMREALEAVNNTGDIFSNAPSLDVARTMK